MKKIFAGVLLIVILCSIVGCSGESKIYTTNRLRAFYNKIEESQQLLDAVADDIYSNWYDAIYNDKFGDDINLAVASARIDHKGDLERLEVLESEISTLFKLLKDDETYGRLAKEVMSAYGDYYAFVVNVSGSFNSYSAEKETIKKELARLLRDLSYEL